MSRASGYPSSRLAGSKPQEITFSNSQTNLHGVELDSDQIQPEYGNTGSYGSEVGSGHDGSMVSYEASQVSFAKALRSPLTTLLVGRGANPVSYLIHTSILAPYPQLTKGLVKVTLAAPANGSGSNKNTTNALDQCSGSAAALTTQLPLKEYDSQIVSSLLSFLYTDEYWPSVEQIIGSSAVQKGVIIEETTGNQLLFTSQALTTHHFKLALLSSKYSIDGLIGIARQKMALTLQDLPPKELLEVIRVIYSKGYSFREKFFEFLSIESVEDENRKSGKCFWSRELLGKLMSNDQEMDYGSDGDGLQSVMDIRNQFLAMVQEGGDLARDALTASWKLGFSSLEPRLSLNSEAV